MPAESRSLEVVRAGPLASVQDLGRLGQAHLGVGCSGAADRSSAALANRLVANDHDAAVLECTLGGLTVRARGDVTIALTGAALPAYVGDRAITEGAPVLIRNGEVLRLGVPATGLRTYLAVRGGIAVTPVLGSRSYDGLAALGPPPLIAGMHLPVGPAPRRLPSVDHVPLAPQSATDRTETLHGWWGPHEDALAPGGRSAMRGAVWTVGADSDRSGLRLEGLPLRRRSGAEWPPEGLARGAVQLPPSGLPVLMQADHPATGGYPVIGVLDLASCDRAAQLRPGDRIELRLKPVS